MIGIVNYGAGNIFSLTAALDRIGVAYGMVDEERDFAHFDRIIIPGVGHAGTAMRKLTESGLVEQISKLEKPVLGICVGMQLLSAFSEEGDADMLGIMPLRTLHFDGRISEKVPHMGWNSIFSTGTNTLFQDVPDGSYFYFVHSYFLEVDVNCSAALCHYGLDFSAAVQKDNFFGVQFHPEKSGKAGEQVLLNFAKL
ncbi:imidazole glycerol phosphate synthase subunit HisH [Sphingobacterium griseoflavum]|nr:imidazole glycerol phosphate synthase subunit HisH [Sphingobacterium griseoflavum]